MEQKSPEWYAARLGRVTGSKVADVIAKTKSGYSTSRANYMMQLALERLKGCAEETYSNAAMEWGNLQEPVARATYEALTGNLVDEVGFIPHPSLDMAGASPDGLVGEDGLLEIKCPNSLTHFEYIKGGKPPTKYVPQMAFQMACTKRDWCDFMSFDPRMPEGLQVFLVRYFRDQAYIRELELEIAYFLDELEMLIEGLMNKRNQTILLEIK